eukprot:symbB.v1.2.022248.t1/scaffold1967.1/size94462/3
MEDGVRPSDDGEPDVFFSHSYTDNCRRVDMALFECNCPNHLTCCSHLYAAAVALPEYRHRAALLWALRQDLGFHAGGHDFEQVSNGPRGGFEAARRRLKAALLKRLNLEELVDCALDASVGLWARVEWLRLGQKPKMEKYWLDMIERNLLPGTEGISDAGRSFQERLKASLEKLQMKHGELGPLLLALAEGHSEDDSRSARWAKVSEKFWSQLLEAPKKEEDRKKASGFTEAEVRLAAVAAALEACKDPKWSQMMAAEKLWSCEQRLLKDLKADSLPALNISKAGSKEIYKSFVEFLADWTEAPPELRFSGESAGVAAEFIDREAAMLLSELCGAVTHDPDQTQEALSQLLKRHFVHGEDSDWSQMAKRCMDSSDEVGGLGGPSAVLTALGASWPWNTVTDVQATVLGSLAKDGWEEAGFPKQPFGFLDFGSRVIKTNWMTNIDQAATHALEVAPSMVDLRAWLHWDVIFHPTVGPLRDFLQRVASRLGIGILELPALQFWKLDLSKGTSEAFASALLSMSSSEAAEALLAFLHSSGGNSGQSLEALKPSYRKVAEELKEAFASVAGQLLSKLPEPFLWNLEVVRMIIEPFRSNEMLLNAFAEAAGHAGEHAALMVNVPSLLRPLAKRLTDVTDPKGRITS